MTEPLIPVPTDGIDSVVLDNAITAAADALNEGQDALQVAVAIMESLMDFEGPHASYILDQHLKPKTKTSVDTFIWHYDTLSGEEKVIRFLDAPEGYYIVNPSSSFWCGPNPTREDAEDYWETSGKYDGEQVVHVGPKFVA